MLKLKEAKEQADALLSAHKALKRILALAKDHKQDWGSRSEISMFRVSLGRCLKPEVSIEIWLTSHTGAFRGVNLTPKEKRQYAADDKHARAFVLSVLADFKVKATRDSKSPDNLRVKLTNEINLNFYGFPTLVTYKCEQQCVAVLPDGKQVAMSDVPIEV